LPSNYEKVKSIKPLKIPFELTVGLAHVKENGHILITDPESSSIRIMDENGNYMRAVYPNELLQKPGAICVSSKSEIFIVDMCLEKIFVFDKDLIYLREFGDSRLQWSFNMIIDFKTDIIYMTSFLNNNLTAWNGNSGEFLNEISLNSPLTAYIAPCHEKILVISAIDVGIFSREYTAQISENNDNCIFVIDKKSLEILQSIDISKFIQPKGLMIDEKMNFYITAAEIEQVNINETNNKKPSRHLIKFNENGEALQKTLLELEDTFQVIFFEKKLLISRGFRSPQLFLIEFY
jgi:hypothetical protein